MRAKIAIFLFGITVGMWTDAILVEMNSTTTVYEWIVGPSVDMLEPVEDVDTAVDEEEEPDANWLNEATPKWRPA